MRRGIAAAAICCSCGVLVSVPGPAAASTIGDWSTFHGDALHDGVSPDATIGAASASSLAVTWSKSIDGSPVIASPMVVYSTSLKENLVYEVSVSGEAEAFDSITGASVWTRNVGAGVVDSPAVDADTFYVGNDGGLLTALNASTGVVDCTYQLPIFAPETTPGRIQASPVVGHDSTGGAIVYFGDTGQSESVNHGREWAINGVANSLGDCTKKWMHDLGKPGKSHSGTWSPPALGVDTTGRTLVVFGTGQPDDAVYALDASNGSQVWRFQTLKNFPDADVGAGPTIGAPGVNGIANGVVYIDGKDKIEYALDLLSGTLLWQFNLAADAGSNVNSVSCAALVGNMVIVAYAKYVYAFDATTGTKLWRSVAMSGNVLGSVIVSGAPGDQVVLIGDLTARVYAFRLSDGLKLLAIHLASKTRTDASIAISDGKAYVAAENGLVYGLS